MDASEATLPKSKHDTTHSRLKAVDLRRLKPGMYHDGGGLWLQVRGESRSWLFRYSRDKQAKVMGLGPLHTIGLADARQKARECRKLLLEGMDPIEAREGRRAAQRTAMTFKDAAEAYIAAHEVGWKNPKHRAQWRSTLSAYVYPVLGDVSVAKVDTAAVMNVLLPIWTAKPETASRVRGRIESVIDWATASGFRSGDNPARWQGLLDNLLPNKANAQRAKREEAGRGEHHQALPHREVREFMAKLREQNGTAARALPDDLRTFIDKQGGIVKCGNAARPRLATGRNAAERPHPVAIPCDLEIDLKGHTSLPGTLRQTGEGKLEFVPSKVLSPVRQPGRTPARKVEPTIT